MSEDAVVAKTLLKQAQENLKKAKEDRYNEKVRAEFGRRSKELLEATKEGKNSITFTVTLNEQEMVDLKDLFLEEGLSVCNSYNNFDSIYDSIYSNSIYKFASVWGYPDWYDCYKKFRSDKSATLAVTFTVSVP